MWNAVVFALVPELLCHEKPLAVTLSNFHYSPPLGHPALAIQLMWFALQSQGKLLTAIVQDKVNHIF